MRFPYSNDTFCMTSFPGALGSAGGGNSSSSESSEVSPPSSGSEPFPDAEVVVAVSTVAASLVVTVLEVGAEHAEHRMLVAVVAVKCDGG